jgi:pectinesterase
MKKVFLLILFISNFISAQEIVKDTSFTIYSTAKKIKKEYPKAKLVNAVLPDNVAYYKNLVYTSYPPKDSTGVKRDIHLDLFEPKDVFKGPYPAVIIIHGGGWRSGDRTMELPTAYFIASNGYVTAVVEYRLSTEALYPAAVYDLKAAIRFIRANAPKYNIDPNKIAVSGCSAGGQLAAFLGVTGGHRKFEGNGGNLGISSVVQAVVDIDGILDFTNPAESGKDSIESKPSAGKYWFGYSYKEKPNLWIEASPLFYVREDSPPYCFINSSQERYHAGRDEMTAKFDEMNIYYEVHTIKNTPHPFWLFHPWFDEAMKYYLGFLDKVFKGNKN